MSTATMFDSLPFGSISLAPSDKDTVIVELIVLTDIPSTKSVDLTFASGATCVPKVASNIATGMSPNAFNSNSASNDPKASFVGAKTVNGDGSSDEDNIETMSTERPSVVIAATKVDNAGLETAKVTTVGSPITSSTTCTIPFEATISAATTLEIPLKVTPEEVSKYKLKLSPSMLDAFVVLYPEPASTRLVEFTVPEITWFKRILLRTSVGTSERDIKPFAAKNVSNASFVGANTVNSPPLNTSTKFPSATDNAATRLLKSGVSIAISTILEGPVGVVTSSSSSEQDCIENPTNNKNVNLDNFSKFFI